MTMLNCVTSHIDDEVVEVVDSLDVLRGYKQHLYWFAVRHIHEVTDWMVTFTIDAECKKEFLNDRHAV